MFTIHGLDNAHLDVDRCVLTVGNFDGVHLAHQRLIAEALQAAEAFGVPAIALTFDPHPLTIVAPARAPVRLCTLSDKLAWLDFARLDGAVVARSEPQLLSTEPEAFVRDVLVAKFHPTCIIEGPTFGFGRGRKGTPELLRQMGPALDFSVRIVEQVTVDADGETVTVSSSLIRGLVRGGDMSRAALCLGRPYQVTGMVIRGHGRGRKLGFPTANLGKIEQLIPADGVYSGRANVGDSSWPCAVSIGSTPTFGANEARQVEVYLLDFDGDLYGEELRVEFDQMLRPQQKFASLTELSDQLLRDVQQVRNGAAAFDSCTPRVHRYEATA
ncbi:MAG: bifunctional riboflavin kinase/FAD synthetase [Planctomycetes bacterium]|nr:bifunctional riboflavin kinase/FAD synthetase [Planctomycetota bacterium]